MTGDRGDGSRAGTAALRHGTDYRVLPLGDGDGDGDGSGGGDRSGTAAVLITGNHRLLLAPAATARRLEAGEDHLLPDERTAWERLRAEAGVGDDTHRTLLAESALSDGADFAVNVNLTNVCNLACAYCFAEGGDYGRITEAMGEHSVAWIFDFIATHAAPGQRVRFEFFGGEPLANLPVIRTICERARGIAERDGTRFLHRVSTNLTLLPPGTTDLFREYGFIVSVSIDGGRQVQDANRPSKNGKGSYDRILRNLRRVRAECGDAVTLVARMTIATAEPRLKDSVRDLWRLDLFDHFQIYPGVYPVRTGTTVPVALTLGDRTLSEPQGGIRYINHFLQPGIVEQFKEFLADYPHLFDPGNRFQGVLEYERTVQMISEGAAALAFCSGGRTYYTHSPDGSVSPCHRLVGDEGFDVGTGERGITREHPEWRRSVDEHPVCGGCWARYLCGGGCRQENHVATGDLNTLNTESCQYQLMLAEEVVKMLARATTDYRDRSRTRYDDLFVSCGRPVVPSARAAPPAPVGDYGPFRLIC
ncbi:radical SAM protein [Streptomyces sp. NPDC047974]|uniref:radical SAM/SPASM domain-containing protein n=1 Tax=Streptomyces sp. NPDC047974 TaxID=3154343 RepID=UPI003405540F